MLAWNPWALPALVAAVLAIAVAVVVHRSRPGRLQNSSLAAALALGGVSAGLYFGLRLLLVDPAHAWLAAAAGTSVLVVSPLPYLLFLGTLDTPLTRALGRRWARVGLVALFVGLEAVWLANPRAVIAGVAPFTHIEGWNLVAGPLLMPVALGPLLAAELYGFVAAVSAYRVARTPIARSQAAAYAVAFGLRDLLGAAFIVVFGALQLHTTPLGEPLFSVGIPLIDALFFLLLGYAVLRHQLFDIDLRIKTTIRQSTVAAAFAGAFFAASEGIEALLPLDGTAPGIVAAAGVALALRPVRRLAQRVADTAMPSVTETPSYVAGRKVEVYRAALESGWSDGSLSAKERAMLERIRGELGLGEVEAARIEEDVRARLAPLPAMPGAA